MIQSERFQMRIASALLEALDEWRRRQRDLPSRSEAIKRMMARVLEADGIAVRPADPADEGGGTGKA